jgi:hypothetical protein
MSYQGDNVKENILNHFQKNIEIPEWVKNDIKKFNYLLELQLKLAYESLKKQKHEELLEKYAIMMPKSFEREEAVFLKELWAMTSVIMQSQMKKPAHLNRRRL